MTSRVCEACHEHMPVAAVADGVCVGCRTESREPVDFAEVTL